MRRLAAVFCLTAVLLTSCLEFRPVEEAPYPSGGTGGMPVPFFAQPETESEDPAVPAPPVTEEQPSGDPIPAETAEEEKQPEAAGSESLTETVPPHEPEPEEEPEPEPEPVKNAKFAENPVSVTFLAAGDNLIHPNIYTDAAYRGTAEKEYDFLPMYADVREKIAAADVAFLNQETVMAGEEYGYTGYPCFNCPRQLGLDLIEIGFDVFNLANNHMLDKGAGGLEATIEFWNSQPVTQLGGYLDEKDAETVRVTETEGVRFAWLSYTYGTNGIVKPESSPLVVPYIDDGVLLRDLAAAEEAGDFTIVSIHWGDENTQTVNAEQKRLARLLADNGADVILGHHSHTLEPIEWIETERGRTLCIYSLGNFVSGMANPVNMVGGFLNFTVKSDEQGELFVDDVYFDPTVFFYGMDWYNTHIYNIEDYTTAVSPNHGLAISGYTLSPDKAMEYVTNVMDGEFLNP